VKIRGYRIELGEIESALVDHPAVLQAAVVVRDEGPGGPRLGAYAVVEEDRGPTVSDLRAALERTLPGYMVPSAFVFLDAFPLTPNGKVDRRALPAPGDDRPELAGGFVAPRTAVEEELAAVWRDVLDVERVGVTDNFFALGGHSLLATQVMTRVEEAFGQEAPVRLLFEAPTIEALAERLVESGLGDMDQDALARALDDIENLTEDELEALLAPGEPADRTG
jgi:acyl carrier protein